MERAPSFSIPSFRGWRLMAAAIPSTVRSLIVMPQVSGETVDKQLATVQVSADPCAFGPCQRIAYAPVERIL